MMYTCILHLVKLANCLFPVSSTPGPSSFPVFRWLMEAPSDFLTFAVRRCLFLWPNSQSKCNSCLCFPLSLTIIPPSFLESEYTPPSNLSVRRPSLWLPHNCCRLDCCYLGNCCIVFWNGVSSTLIMKLVWPLKTLLVLCKLLAWPPGAQGHFNIRTRVQIKPLTSLSPELWLVLQSGCDKEQLLCFICKTRHWTLHSPGKYCTLHSVAVCSPYLLGFWCVTNFQTVWVCACLHACDS